MTFADVHVLTDYARRPRAERAENNDLDGFLTALTDLSRTYGFAISNAPELFMMEREDYAFAYRCDADGRLVRR